MEDHDKLVCTREFWTEIEASSAQALLAENGIESVTQGGQIKTTMSYYGSVIGGVKLMVSETDAPQARALLEATRESLAGSAASAPWICPRCRSQVDAGFDVCWNCGTAADVPSPGDSGETDDWGSDSMKTEASHRTGATGVSHEVSPRSERGSSAERGDHASSEVASEATDRIEEAAETDDDVALRFVRAALLGILCLPVSLFGLWLFGHVEVGRLSRKGKWNYFLGTGLLALTFAMWIKLLFFWGV